MVKLVTETARTTGEFDVTCPHCHKQFRAEPMADRAPRYTGFKCPHCKLFVAFDRAADGNTTP
jgi:phage FluMu protein Com